MFAYAQFSKNRVQNEQNGSDLLSENLTAALNWGP